VAFTLLRFAAVVSVGGSVVAVAVPAFVQSLSASKWSEPLDGLGRISRGALAHAASHPLLLAFPPSAPQTPESIPRGARVSTPPEVWGHLTWRALDFRMTEPHAYAYQFDSAFDPATQRFRFAATASGDLDGDGNASTFQVQGEAPPEGAPVVFPGMLIAREVE
jgi:hypothetical protein